MTRIRDMRNLGPSSEKQLAEIDVTDAEGLKRLGAAEAFRRLSFVLGRPANLNLLFAMEGALTYTDWRAIPPARKAALKSEIGGA